MLWVPSWVGCCRWGVKEGGELMELSGFSEGKRGKGRARGRMLEGVENVT